MGHEKMSEDCGQVKVTIDARAEAEAEEVQQYVRTQVARFRAIVDASADEPVESDEFGHAG